MFYPVVLILLLQDMFEHLYNVALEYTEQYESYANFH